MIQMTGCQSFTKSHEMFRINLKKILLLLACVITLSFGHIDTLLAMDIDGVNRVRYCKEYNEVKDIANREYGVNADNPNEANKAGKIIINNNIVVQSGFEGTFNPAGNFRQSKEYEFIISNPSCAGIFSAFYAVRILMYAMASKCGLYNKAATLGIYPNILRDLDLFANAARNSVGNPICFKAYTAAQISYVTTILGGIGIQYELAKANFKKIRVCGSDWYYPGFETDGANAKLNQNYLKYFDDGVFKKEVSDYVKTNKCKGNLDSDLNCRQYYYDGKEFEDNIQSGKACTKGEEPQKYYMRGLFAGNFNCDQYEDPDEKKCCLERKSEYICLEDAQCSADNADKDEDEKNKCHVFCRIGETCNLANAQIKVVANNNNLICANTVNFCPFDFSIGGGSDNCIVAKDAKLDINAWKDSSDIIWEYEDGDPASQVGNGGIKDEDEKCADTLIKDSKCKVNANEKYAGKCLNGCQYLRHCTVVDIGDNEIEDKIASPYMPMACIDLVGDSRHTTEYSGLLIGTVRNFSAPIAQCFKETIENLFYNRVGRSKCSDFKISPKRKSGTEQYCDNYALINQDVEFPFVKGGKVREKSSFDFIQERMRDIVKYALFLSVTIYGFTVIAGYRDVSKRSEIMLYIAKIALIAYFALGNAWQSAFFEFIYDAPIKLSYEMMKLTADDDKDKRDGCQFGNVYNKDGNLIVATEYPKGKYYLAIWDTLDCKIMHYLGFGPSASFANIAILIFAGFFTGSLGVYLAISILFFAIFLILLTVRALYIFIGSSILIVMMVFVSPIIFSFLLFEKTKDIFGKWLNALIGYSLQPIFLLAYIYIAIFMMDNVLIGSAKFKDGEIQCDNYCIMQGAEEAVKESEDGYEQCKTASEEMRSLFTPKSDSVMCIINFDNFGTAPGFEAIALTIPVLVNIASGDFVVIAITMLKAALVMLLLSSFVGEIPGITNSITGTSSIKFQSSSPMDIMKKASGAMRSVQKRVNRAATSKGRKFAKGISRSESGGGKMQQGGNTTGSSGSGSESSGSSGKNDSSKV